MSDTKNFLRAYQEALTPDPTPAEYFVGFVKLAYFLTVIVCLPLILYKVW